MSQTIKTLLLKDKEIILLGTAHVSSQSIEEVTKNIQNQKPDCVAIELDSERYESMKNPESWRNMDITKILKSGKGFVLLANLVLASFQKRIGSDMGVKPGEEMKAAYQTAHEMGIPTELVDRPIQITLRRAWAKNSIIGKSKLLATMIASAFETEKVSAEQIENLKTGNEMDSMLSELSSFLPQVKTVLIDERDSYLANKIWQCSGKKILAVLGAGHLPGVEKHLEQLAVGTELTNIDEISQIPPPSVFSKAFMWAIPILIVGLITLGFFRGGIDTTLSMLLKWLLVNGSLSALGAIIALGHPLAVLVSFIGAPFTSLNPFIGIGILSGLTQAAVKKPKVEDMEHLMENITSLKGWYKNRILRILLVFFLSSVGSSIGTFVAFPALISVLKL